MPLFGGAFLFFCSPIAFFLSDNRKNVASAFLSDGCLVNVTFLCNIFHYYRKNVASAFLSDGCLMNVTFLCNIFHYYRKKMKYFF